VEIHLHVYLILAQDYDNCSALFPGRLTPSQIRVAHVTSWRGGWMHYRTGLGSLGKRISLSPKRIRPHFLSRQARSVGVTRTELFRLSGLLLILLYRVGGTYTPLNSSQSFIADSASRYYSHSITVASDRLMSCVGAVCSCLPCDWLLLPYWLFRTPFDFFFRTLTSQSQSPIATDGQSVSQ
jgi:hypothetical protein